MDFGPELGGSNPWHEADGNQVFPDTLAGAGPPHRADSKPLICLEGRPTPFQLCPLMRTSRTFRYFRPSSATSASSIPSSAVTRLVVIRSRA